jgi:two-component system NtrC family sensor kinase
MLQVEKMASLGNLASSVAHELNNPLEGILTYAKLINKRLGKSSLPQDVLAIYQEELTLIAHEAARCGAIVKNLLIFARQRKLAISTIRFREILNRSVMLVQHHAQINNVRIESRTDANDSIQCDQDHIQQVLVALMINAIEAMASTRGRPEGGVLKVEAECDPQADALVVHVVDNGPGMEDTVRAHIFEPFFTTKTDSKGVGLGLAIAYGIVERHNGTISVESRPGQGTEFTIRLPVRQPEAGGKSQVATSDGAKQ